MNVSPGDSVLVVIGGQPTRPGLVERVIDAGRPEGPRLDLVVLLDTPAGPRQAMLQRIPQLEAQIPGVPLGWIPPPEAGPPEPIGEI